MQRGELSTYQSDPCCKSARVIGRLISSQSDDTQSQQSVLDVRSVDFNLPGVVCGQTRYLRQAEFASRFFILGRSRVLYGGAGYIDVPPSLQGPPTSSHAETVG